MKFARFVVSVLTFSLMYKCLHVYVPQYNIINCAIFAKYLYVVEFLGYTMRVNHAVLHNLLLLVFLINTK